MFVELTQHDDRPITINFNCIASIQPTDGGTRLLFSDGQESTIQEHYDDVIDNLRNAGAAIARQKSR